MLTGDPGSTEPLVVTHDGPIATLWLNRPEKRNAVTKAMWEGIAAICADLATDRNVRVLVVRGAGDHFCAGADIGELAVSEASYAAANAGADHALGSFPKPTVAFIRGSCVGGGTQIAIACDVRIADTSAVFGITPARLGIVYPAFGVDRAVRLLGPSATKHLLFSAELIGWERALRIGLVDEVHEAGRRRRADRRVRDVARDRAVAAHPRVEQGDGRRVRADRRDLAGDAGAVGGRARGERRCRGGRRRVPRTEIAAVHVGRDVGLSA